MASPKTLNMRERVALPTGAIRGPSVSLAGMPRARPCVGVKAIARTVLLVSWDKTSRTISSSLPVRSKEWIGGTWFSNRMSTIPPRTETTEPNSEGAGIVFRLLKRR